MNGKKPRQLRKDSSLMKNGTSKNRKRRRARPSPYYAAQRRVPLAVSPMSWRVRLPRYTAVSPVYRVAAQPKAQNWLVRVTCGAEMNQELLMEEQLKIIP